MSRAGATVPRALRPGRGGARVLGVALRCLLTHFCYLFKALFFGFQFCVEMKSILLGTKTFAYSTSDVHITRQPA